MGYFVEGVVEQFQEGERNMVLANALRAVLATLAGAALFAVVSYYSLALFARWYGPRYIHSDSDINDVLCADAHRSARAPHGGAYLGYRWARKRNPGSA